MILFLWNGFYLEKNRFIPCLVFEISKFNRMHWNIIFSMCFLYVAVKLCWRRRRRRREMKKNKNEEGKTISAGLRNWNSNIDKIKQKERTLEFVQNSSLNHHNIKNDCNSCRMKGYFSQYKVITSSLAFYPRWFPKEFLVNHKLWLITFD